MRLPLRSSHPAASRHATQAHAAVAVPRVPAAQLRRRAEGGPVDHATYPCPCGYVFVAPVSTSVDCPHCGTGQAW